MVSDAGTDAAIPGSRQPHSIRWSTWSADCGNERGNIEKAILRMPRFGRAQEILFVGGAIPPTLGMRARRDDYKGAVLKQDKGDAVREEHYPNRDDYRHA